MSIEEYKARARRLSSHLATRHNLTLAHSAALEAVAAEEGARDWNVLSARGSVVQPLPANDPFRRKATPGGTTHMLLLVFGGAIPLLEHASQGVNGFDKGVSGLVRTLFTVNSEMAWRPDDADRAAKLWVRFVAKKPSGLILAEASTKAQKQFLNDLAKLWIDVESNASIRAMGMFVRRLADGFPYVDHASTRESA